MKTPQKLTLDILWNAYQAESAGEEDVFYNRDGLALLMEGNPVRIISHFMRMGIPFLVDDYRLGMVKSGSVRVVLNLMERRLERGMLIFITPGTVLEPIGYTDDFRLEGIGLSPDYFHLAHGERLPDLFNGQVRDGQLIADDGELAVIHRMLSLLWQVVHAGQAEREAIAGIVMAITHYYNALFSRRKSVVESQPTSAHALFERFISLVNRHCRRQRRLAFYAGELCVTERYLGTIVRQVSGVTAKEWIDKAVIAQAKVMLRHGALPVARIAEALDFPNPSFFCKYFKRLTGETPASYRSLVTHKI